GAGLGEEILKGRLVGLLKTVGRAEAWIEIILEVRPKVYLVEGVTLVALRLGCDLFYAAIALRLFQGDVIDEGNTFLQLFQHWIFHNLGVDQLLQLQLVERQ